MIMTGIGSAYAASDKATYRLKWLFNCSTIGELYAMEKRLFAKTGLEVTVKAGGPERDAIKELELGYAQFGVASADQVIRARAKGAPVVVIAQLFQVNPLQWIYRADETAVNRLEDLKGKVLGITYGGNDENIMRTLLAKGGITEKQVTLASVRYDYTPFYQKKVDLWPVYRNTQGVFIGHKLQKAGERVAYFEPAKHGIQFVANSVVTSEKILKGNPDLVKRFLGALMKGWRESLQADKQNEVITILKRYDKDTAEELLPLQLVTTRQLVKPTSDTKIGTIDVAAWKMTEQIMLEQHLINEPVRVETALHPFPELY